MASTQDVESEVKALLRGIPDRTDSLMFKDADAVFQLDLSEGHSAYVHFKDGRSTVHAGTHPKPDATLSMRGHDFVALCKEELNQFRLIADGVAKLSGDGELIEKVRWVLYPMKPALVALLDRLEAQFRREPVTAVPEFPEFTEELLREHGPGYRPFLVRGGWRGAARKWTLDSVEADFGHLPFTTEAGVTTLKDYIGRIRRGGFVNSNATRLPPEVDEHFDDDLPWALASRVVPPFEIFFTSRGSYSQLHRDMTDGAVTCLLGPREFRLFGPEQREFLYCFKNAAHDYQSCHVNTVDVDWERFPGFRQARPLTVILSPGDLLYLPTGWFHQVVSLADSMALKFMLPRGWLSTLETP